MKDQRKTKSRSPLPPTPCMCMCSDVKPDVEINQTVFCFPNEYCQDSPIGKMPFKITDNMFCAGSSLESTHSCQVTLFPWPLLSLLFPVYIQEEIKVIAVQEGMCPPSNHE